MTKGKQRVYEALLSLGGRSDLQTIAKSSNTTVKECARLLRNMGALKMIEGRGYGPDRLRSVWIIGPKTRHLHKEEKQDG